MQAWGGGKGKERIRDECRMREERRRENGSTSSRSLFCTSRLATLFSSWSTVRAEKGEKRGQENE